ncbi:hypothetical protein [Thioclava sp. GXIMD4215]|uniref:hypothetical protein n=1 Tax=Thioclava sp. GXIMD4215 TaxID=3131928 RepID=UPI003243A44C
MTKPKETPYGVPLNDINYKRPYLTRAERNTARKLRAEGHFIHHIAAMLGTNTARVSSAIRAMNTKNRASNDGQGSLF